LKKFASKDLESRLLEIINEPPSVAEEIREIQKQYVIEAYRHR